MAIIFPKFGELSFNKTPVNAYHSKTTINPFLIKLIQQKNIK